MSLITGIIGVFIGYTVRYIVDLKNVRAIRKIIEDDKKLG